MQYLLFFLVLLITPSVIAKVYKWVDEEGKVHYSQVKPLDDVSGNSKEIDPKELGKYPTSNPREEARRTRKRNQSLYEQCVSTKRELLYAVDKSFHRNVSSQYWNFSEEGKKERNKLKLEKEKLKKNIKRSIKKECEKYRDEWK